MERKRLTLDNPVFSGTLRHERRSVVYTRRSLQPATISDMVAIRTAQPIRRTSTSLPAKRMLQARLSVTQPQSQSKPMPATKSLDSTGNKQRKLNLPPRFGLYAMAAIIFVIGLAATINGMLTNHQVSAQVKQLQHSATQNAGVTDAPPSTDKPSAAAVRSYTVSPNIPRYLDIPKLGIHTRILSMGVDKKNELQVPWNIYDTGWYNASAQPGQNGAMLVDGHSGIGKVHGVFYKLATLTSGDTVSVTRGDGRVFTYKTVKVQTVDVKSVDMGSMLVSADTSKPGLNLITCTGDQIPGTTQLNKRVLVYAVQQ